jgi:hydrogenase/urease accessory protein HupE
MTAAWPASRPRCAWRLASAGLGAWLPQAASAHLVDTGLGPIYDGISHTLLSPEDLLPVLAVALLGGLNGSHAARHALWTLPLAWLVGGLAGFWAGRASEPAVAAASTVLILGALVAIDRRLAPAVVAALALGIGLMNGWFNGAGLAAAGRSGAGLVGMAATVFVLVALASALIVRLRAPWTRVGVRVAGSWIAAIGLLMLGWGLRGAAA